MAKVAQKTKQSEITEQDSLLLTRNLLRIAIFNISYIRGLFPESYFNDKDVSALDMKVKKLMPIDDDSRRLIDWMEKGVYDALQKKYLKTLLFCICESVDGPMIEEYSFSFTYSTSDNEEVSMNINRRGNKKHGATFKSNSNEITPEQMRFSACKMIRTLIQLMRTLDQMPDERTILMKLLYYDDVTPEDYEPPFFRKSSDSESNNTWTKDPLKMDVGNINSRHLVLSLKVKSVLDPCEDENDNDKEDDEMSIGTALEHDAISESDGDQSQENQYIVEPVGNRAQNDDNSMTDDDYTQNSEMEEENTTRIRNWILSRDVNDVSLKDIRTNFQDISLVLTEEIVGKLLEEGLISNSGRESYAINREKDINHDPYFVKEENDMDFKHKIDKIHRRDNDDLYTKALYHTLPMDYVTVSKLQSKLEGEANQGTVRKLIKKMETDGFIESKGFGKLGKPVIHSDFTNNKLLEIKRDMGSKTTQAKETNDQTIKLNGMEFSHSHGSIPRNGSTCAALHSFGSEFTRTRVLSETLRNTSLQNGQPSDSKSPNKSNTPTSRPEPISSLESGVNGIVKTKDYDRIPREADVSVCTRSIQDKRIRKIDSVVNPILQYVKRQKNQMA